MRIPVATKKKFSELKKITLVEITDLNGGNEVMLKEGGITFWEI